MLRLAALLLLLLLRPATADMLLLGAGPPPAPTGFVMANFTNSSCSEAGGASTCTTTLPITVTAGHILLVMTNYCASVSCTTVTSGQITAIGSSAGTGALGTCAPFSGANPSSAGEFASLWWCPVNTSGTVTPQETFGVAQYYGAVGYVDVAGASVTTPDAGLGNFIAQSTASSMTIALSGSAASGDLLILGNYVNAYSGSSISTGWVDFGSSGLQWAFNANASSGTNTVTASFPSATGFAGQAIAAIVPAGPPTITGITLSNTSFPAGTAGTVGTATAQVSNATWSGTWSLQTSGTVGGTTCTNNPVFSINSSTGVLSVTSSGAIQSYPGVCVVATQAGLGGSPFAQAFTLTGTPNYVFSGYVEDTSCAGPFTTCTPASTIITLTTGHVALAMVGYCFDSGCDTTTSTAHVSTIAKAASAGGTAVIGTCGKFAGTQNTGSAYAKTEIWACPVTTGGSFKPTITMSATSYGIIDAWVDVAGTATTLANLDDGTGNFGYSSSATALTVGLTGAGATQASELLVFLGYPTNGAAGATLSAGWSFFGSSTVAAYNPAGLSGANSVTYTAPGNGAFALAGAIAALKHP